MADRIELPPPDEIGGMPLALALGRRRSRREFSAERLDWAHVGQLLWAAQGVSHDTERLRNAPSAGALYPLEIDAVVASGLYRYRSTDHALTRRGDHDLRFGVARATSGQGWLAAAPCVFSISAIPSRTTVKYGNRGARYVEMEAGHAAQNLLLAAVSLGLDSVPVGAFDDEDLARVLRLEPGEVPLYLVPVGWPRAPH